jgi:hypothetical protein
MSPNGTAGAGGVARGYIAGGSMVGYPRPDEVVVPLRRDEFDTLCEGGVSDERRSRDTYAGVAAASLVGVLGVLAAAVPAWDTIWKLDRLSSWVFLIVLIILFGLTTGSAVGAFVYRSHMKRTVTNSPFSRVRARLLSLYDEHKPPEPGVSTPTQAG